MNLAIQNLIRNNSIHNLIEFPFSLCIEEGKLGKAMLVIVENLKSNLLVSKFDLSKLPNIDEYKSDILPPKETFYIHPEQLFEEGVIVKNGYKPIKFMYESVDVGLNSFNKPMSMSVYEKFYEQVLNPSFHKKYKRSWLWYNFIKKTNLKQKDSYKEEIKKTYNSNNYNNRHKFIGYCNELSRYYKDTHYDIYKMYEFIEKHTINSIREKGPAGELIFLTQDDL